MKSIIILSLLLMSVAGYGQKSKPDTVLTDSSAIIQIRYASYLMAEIEKVVGDKVTQKEWKTLMELYQKVINQSIAEKQKTTK